MRGFTSHGANGAGGSIDEDLLRAEFDEDVGEEQNDEDQNQAATRVARRQGAAERAGSRQQASQRRPQRKSLYPTLDLDPAPSSRVAEIPARSKAAAGGSTSMRYPSVPANTPAPPRPSRPVTIEGCHGDHEVHPPSSSEAASRTRKPVKKKSMASRLRSTLTSKRGFSRSNLSSSGDAIEESDAGLDIDEANEEEAASAMPPRSFEKDELAQCWYEVFCEVGLPASVAKMYSIGFSKFGIDDQNAGDLTDEDLAANGVANAQHRQIIMRLIQGLLEHQQDQAALDAVSGGVEVGEAQLAEDDKQKEVSWEEVDRQQHKLQEEIAKVDRLEANLARILAGDTDRQRAFKARLAKERAAREQEREQTRRDHALRRAKRAMERVQKDIDEAQ